MPPPDLSDSWADLVQLRKIPQSVPGVAARPSRRLTRLLLVVLLPTVTACLYFGLIAPDRYVAEARFMVRKPASISAQSLPVASPEQTLQGGDEDGYAVRDFILSRDGMQALLDQGDLRQAIARSGADPLWRYPGKLTGDTNEDLFRYYLRLVSVVHETTSGVTTLRVQAFDPEDARRLAATLTDAAEGLLNRLQERARQDAIRIADGEVDRTRELADAAQLALTGFRTREAVVDPSLLSQTVLNTISALSLQVVQAAAQLDLLLVSSANSPQIPPLRSRVAALQTQIDRERATLAGTDKSFAPKIAEYERLVLQRDFAVRNFISALTALETARLDALRQRVYLERVVQPRAADQPAYPYRVLWILVVLGIGLIVLRLFPLSPAIPRPMPAPFL